MQKEKKMPLPSNALKNHKKVTSLYLALLCGASGECVCVTPLPLITDRMRV